MALAQRKIFYLFLNSASSFALRDKQFISIFVLNMARRFFLYLDVIAESEAEEGIPSSIMPIKDDLVFFRYHFETLQVNNSYVYRIHRLERPHKKIRR